MKIIKDHGEGAVLFGRKPGILGFISSANRLTDNKQSMVLQERRVGQLQNGTKI